MKKMGSFHCIIFTLFIVIGDSEYFYFVMNAHSLTIPFISFSYLLVIDAMNHVKVTQESMLWAHFGLILCFMKSKLM